MAEMLPEHLIFSPMVPENRRVIRFHVKETYYVYYVFVARKQLCGTGDLVEAVLESSANRARRTGPPEPQSRDRPTCRSERVEAAAGRRRRAGW